MNEIFKPFQDFITQNPEYGYLVGVAAFGLLLLGVIFDWNWVVMPDSASRGSFHRFLMTHFGRKTTRIWLGVTTAMAVIAFLFLFFF